MNTLKISLTALTVSYGLLGANYVFGKIGILGDYCEIGLGPISNIIGFLYCMAVLGAVVFTPLGVALALLGLLYNKFHNPTIDKLIFVGFLALVAFVVISFLNV